MLARFLAPYLVVGWLTVAGILVGLMVFGRQMGGAVVTYLREVEIYSGGQLIDKNFDVFVVDVYHGVVHNLTKHRSEDVAFSWAPDAEKLAIISNRYGGRDYLFLMNQRGEMLTRLDTPFAPFSPQWSPTGERIAFFENQVGGLSDIFTLPISGGVAINLTRTVESSEANISWSPDGKYIATSFLDRAEITILAADGSGNYRFAGNGNLPSWSPDGQQIAYRDTRSGGSTLWRAAMNTSAMNQVSQGDAGFIAYFAPQWSPNSRVIAYLTNQGGRYLVRLVDIVAETERTIPLPLKNIGTPIWSPDGTLLTFHAHPTEDRGDTYIYVLDVASGAFWNLNVKGRSPNWRPETHP